ncbi:hypothetical protein N1851_013069 [Merluccius polli]|uniref:Uncharacterized protein n=1 Tax=Merluccius polli TaxID=89951 RepID=A0AA47MWJ8_MERPO|nr:hypothetical protein N1851_013069 [Merluccius polli]
MFICCALCFKLVESILINKPCGEPTINEYNRTKSLMDETRRKMVNILAADMTEKNGTSPPRQLKAKYVRGIVTLFPYLSDPFSKNGYMIPILLSNKDIKVLEGWLSYFIWSKRKPRLKMAKLQMTGDEVGLDVPNVRLYQLASHLRVISEWFKGVPASVWFDIESSQSKCPLWNLLFVKDYKSVRDHCTNPITLIAVKAWRSTRTMEGRHSLTSPLTPIIGGPDFIPGCQDRGFRL